MKLITTLTAAGALSVAAVGASAQEKVAISDLNWTGAKAIAHVIKTVIEGPLNSEAEIVEGLSDQAIIGAGMDKGDGSADVWTDMWMPNQQAPWDKYIEDAGTVAHNQPYAGTQQMYVPSYMSDQIKSFEDLKDPAVAAMFDKDGNGKGEYWAGDASWKSTKIWQVKMKSYGLSELWEPEIISDATFKAQLKTSYGNQKPILFYYWTPEWIHAAYDISPLAEPEHTEGCMNLQLDGEDWLEVSEAGCKTPDASIYVSYSKSLEERNPPAAKFLSQIQLDPAVVNDWILKIGRDEMDPQDVAEEWVAENMDIVEGWIN
ncbi:glycine/betaine ABC transporter substrate-binding protein [Tateyamaria omphalii]|uniref:ABC transporter substrate-binding protein n=1 Tax=Tateyamaria omphalii TaxID=299262 RepID=UPI001C995012|nr:glycine betaine ABC transporter substrate-binding protein [Tateyamaria omphalii]MBY5935174.1 glycine/betaine ABC transporter substrate-binding protein [Tateyamaria omphalii]